MNQSTSPEQLIPLDAEPAPVVKKRRWRSDKLAAAGVTVPFFAIFSLFQILPLGWVVINSFKYDEEWSLENYLEILDSAFLQQAFWNSIVLSVGCSLLAIILGTAGAYSLRLIDGKLRSFVIAFSNMTSNFAGVPLAFAFVIILGFNGAFTLLFKSLGWIDDFNLYGFGGLLLIYTYFQLPLALLLLYPAFDALKKDWEEAAWLLGASHVDYWRKIAIPVLTPALLGTFIILLANALGAYATVYALTSGNYNVITIRIASMVSGDIFLDPNLASAVSVLLVLLLAFVTVINQWLMKRSYHEQ